MKYFYYLIITIISFTSQAAVVNSIDFNKYKNFEKKWKLVTVRFRKDTEEMRFTYANDLAYKSLKKGVKVYPDGAVFAKIGIMTGADPAFESSAAPLGARRIQFMVHDNKKYKKGDGWGYALFDFEGNPLPEDPSTQEDACIACHDLAKDRGYVFSQDMFLNQTVVAKPHSSGGNFETALRENLPTNIKELVPDTFKYIKVLKGKIAENIFQGTLDEIRPLLSKESFISKYPAILMAKDGKRFSLIFPEQLGVYCDGEKSSGYFMKSIFTANESGSEKRTLHFCYSP